MALGGMFIIVQPLAAGFLEVNLESTLPLLPPVSCV